MANSNPDQSGLQSWQKGHSGNPGGKTSEQRRRELANAELATMLRGRMLEALVKQLDDALTPDGNDTAAVDAIQADVLRLLKDSEDRGFGAPTTPVEMSGADGGPIRASIEIKWADGNGDD